MKKYALIAALSFAPLLSHCPAFEVETPVLNSITIKNHIEEIARLVAIIEQMQATKDWLGNAANILDIAGGKDVLASLQTVGVGQSRADLAINATSQDALIYDDFGLYQAPGDSFVTRGGRTVARGDEFKPQAAIFNAVRDHDAVMEDVNTRREAIRSAMQQTVSQAQAATTHAEVQKATSVLITQQAELQAIDWEATMSGLKAVLLDIQNCAAAEREQKAKAQEQGEEFSEALGKFTKLLRPPSFIHSSNSFKPAANQAP